MQHPQIPQNILLCLHYIGQGLPHFHCTSCHTQNGLCGCSHNQDTITRCTPCKRTWNYAQTHQIVATLNNSFTYIIGYHTQFLPVSQDKCTDSRWTILTIHRCTYLGQSATTPNI